jgi:hypothetical protein
MTNTLAYIDKELITAVKKFYSGGPWGKLVPSLITKMEKYFHNENGFK